MSTYVDSAPPGWEGTVEQMKSHGEIDNPFALAHWMSGQGYHPHDAFNRDVLDAAHEMARSCDYADTHYDGNTGESAGDKPSHEEQDPYERATENLQPFEVTQMDDEDLFDDGEMNLSHHPLHKIPSEHDAHSMNTEHGAHTPVEAHHPHGHVGESSDEDMLDDGEEGPGEHKPKLTAAATDPAAHAYGEHEPNDPNELEEGEGEVSIEGIEANR
jgi:hypothetical protein